MKRTIQRINKAESWFSEEGNTMDKVLAKLSPKGERDTTLVKPQMKTETLQQIPVKFKEHILETYSLANQNLKEIDTFLGTYDLQKLNQDHIKILKWSEMCNDIEACLSFFFCQ